MRHKTILDLIKNNLEEMSMLTSSLEKTESPDPLLIDIILTKTHALQLELELLKTSINIMKNIEIPAQLKDEPLPEAFSKPVNIENVSKQKEEEPVKNEKKAEKIEVPESDHKEEKVKTEEFVPVEKTNEATIKNDNEKPSGETPAIDKKHPDEPSVATGEKMLLGEKFIKEPTLNERFSDITKKGSKVKGKPVTSIKAAIGINDRFLYLRELFQNNNEDFETSISTLDKLGSFIEAIEYLEKNFKWQKNETSLKFMELVKRRFDDQQEK
ncbi:MAG: hypothetical protein JW798_04195 [Prolixibacteraceae bacterium]|nr:hypothetical protein [Prolixibacteraceae bacterium]